MIEGLEVEKKAARAGLRRLWRELKPDELATLSRQICNRLATLPAWIAARSIMVYTPMRGEIDLADLAIQAFAGGKTVAVPRTDWKTGGLRPVRLRDWPESRAGAPHPDHPGVPVPLVSLPELDPLALDCVIVPGLGFDASGNRLGRGAGFYDRFLLANRLEEKAIGLVPERMILERIPSGAMDAPVGTIVTESRVIRTRER